MQGNYDTKFSVKYHIHLLALAIQLFNRENSMVEGKLYMFSLCSQTSEGPGETLYGSVRRYESFFIFFIIQMPSEISNAKMYSTLRHTGEKGSRTLFSIVNLSWDNMFSVILFTLHYGDWCQHNRRDLREAKICVLLSTWN